MIGKQLLQFLIEAQLGAGGMGEVYQARDTKLGRSVAVKILPELFASDPERIARFEREAKLLASLNHANIAALYGLEQADGKHFLVMELVEGDTLGQRIARGALPVEEALKMAHQIAEALEAAHEKTIIHRDLKPANVKITPEGKVKVLDFGLAKAIDSTPSAINASNSPTMMSAMASNAGMILGTAGYMSPEQARGRAADQRSDIFSFGCVLYEMLTGRLTFEGETVSDVLAAVLKQDADLSLLPANIHSRVVELIRRCLVKDPKQRWHSVADVRVEIEMILAESLGLKVAETVVVERPPLWKRLVPIALTAVVVAAIAAGIAWTLRPQPSNTVSRFTFVLPEGQVVTRGGRHAIAISPDGSNIVYQANRQLYLRPISDVDSRPIEGTNEDVGNVFFSPDGLWIGFFSVAENRLKKVAVTGGASVTIAETELPFGATWAKDDQIFFALPTRGKGIFRVSANGGKPEAVITAKPNELMHGPQLLPDGEHVLYTVTTGTAEIGVWDKAQIAIESLKSRERKVLLEGSDGRYLPTGHIIYAIGTTLFAIRFDASKLNVVGGPVPVFEGVARAVNASAAAQISVAGNGSMIYLSGDATSLQQGKLALVDQSGKSKELPLPSATYAEPRISPDGRQITFVIFDRTANGSIWIYDLSGAVAMRKLTFDSVDYPIWTPDSRRIIFRSLTAGNTILWQQADGNSAAEILDKSQAGSPSSVSPDGQTLVFTLGAAAGGPDLWMMPLVGAHTSKPLVAVPDTQDQPAFSPDGRWIAYRSNEAGRQSQIYVQPFPPIAGVKYQLTTTGGNAPLWSPDGRQIFYLQNGNGASPVFFSVDVQTHPAFTFGNVKQLPITNILTRRGGTLRPYDVTPDGKQFLIVTSGDQPADQVKQPQIRITLNWFEELKQRVP
jgi:serine/threonine-protein kinase